MRFLRLRPLACAVDLARREDRGDHADLLELTYLEALPTARVEQLARAGAPWGWLFHGPLPWPRLPRLRGALARLFALLEASGVDPARALGASDQAALEARWPTLADLYRGTYFGALQPMFSALPHDLALLAAEAEERGDAWLAADHRLAGAVLHELLHGSRHRDALYPPYLDEAIAGYLGAHLDRPTAFPEPGDDNALYGWPWFSQVGQALTRAFGLAPVVRAHFGAAPWSAALPAGLLAAIERLAWEGYRAAPAVHFHPDTTRPERWTRLFYLAARGVDVAEVTAADLDALTAADVALPPDPARDVEIVADALAAACLDAEQRAGGWRVWASPPAGPVTVDFSRGVLTAPARPGRRDPPLVYALPPTGRRDRRVITLDRVDAAHLRARALDLLA